MMVRAAVIPAPHQPVEVRQFPVPDLEPGAALLRTLYSEVCGTDVHLLHGRLPGAPYPLIPGHINVGVLEALRGPVTDAFGGPVREGDTVTFLDVHGTCFHCWHCLVAKASTRCAPASRDSAQAISPTGPEPCTRTVSASPTPPRCTAWKAVGRAHPPAITSSGVRPSGSGMMLTPGLR